MIGLLTGVIVAVIGVHPILVTLGTQTLITGINIWLTHGRTLSGFPQPLLLISNETFLWIPISFIVFMIMAAAVHVLLTRTPLGIRIYLIASNLEATRYSGVDTRRVQMWVYILSSLLCWLAAIIMMARFNSAGCKYRTFLSFDHYPRRYPRRDRSLWCFGRIDGLVVSLAILQMISSGFNLLGFSEHLTLAFWGVTLLAVMAIKRVAATLHPGVDRSQASATLLKSNPEHGQKSEGNVIDCCGERIR